MEIGMAAKEYLIEIEVRKYTPKTIRSYRNNLNLFLRFCHSVGVENVEEIVFKGKQTRADELVRAKSREDVINSFGAVKIWSCGDKNN